MPKVRMTELRFNELKSILNYIPTDRKGVIEIYKTLNISSTTASLVRRSDDFDHYTALRDGRYTPKPKETAPETTGYVQAILDKLDKIDERLAKMEAMLTPIKKTKINFMGRKING